MNKLFPRHFYFPIVFILYVGIISTFAATDTLDATAGSDGIANNWNPGGAFVGTDCSAQGGTESNIASKNSNLSVPIDNTGSSGVISNVQVRVYARSNVTLDPGDGITIAVFDQWTVHADATTYEPANPGPAYYSASWNDSPITSTTWTWAEINALEAGCRSVASGGSSIDILYVDHIEVVVFYNNPPVVTGLSSAANLDNDADQLTDGSGQVVIDFEVSDPDNATVDITLDYWNGSWNSATTTSGFIGSDKDASSSTTDRQIVWEADTDLGAIEVTNYNVRVTATDPLAATDDVSRSSNDLEIDTKAPINLACSSPTDGASPSGPDVTMTSDVASDANTVSYWFEIDQDPAMGSPDDNSDWQSEDNDWVKSLTLGQQYYWHVKAKDSYGNQTSFTDDPAWDFTVSSVKPNIVINSVAPAINGTGLDTLKYDLSDPQAPENCKLLIEHSTDGSTWYQSWINYTSAGSYDNTDVSTGGSTGQITGITTDVTNEKFVWDSKNASNQGGSLDNTEDSEVFFRVTPTDASSNEGARVTSLSFILDNWEPRDHACSSPSDAGSAPIDPTLVSATATDMSSKEYYFELDIDETWDPPLQNSGWQASTSWEPTTLSSSTTYYWRVNARDSYGNEATFQTAYSFTTTSMWTYPTAGTIGACTAPCLGDGVVYVGTGGTDDKVYCIDIDDGSLNWSYQASADVYNVCSFYHSGSGKEAVYFTCSDATLNAIWDNGVNPPNPPTTKFTAVDLGNKTPSEPIIDIDGSNIYLGYDKDGYKRSASNGGAVWQTPGNINPNTSSAPVVDNANVYFAAGATTYKYTTADATAQGSIAHGADTPLGAWASILYVANSNDNYVYAVNMSNMSDKWTSADLQASTNTGFFRAFPSGQSSSYNYGYIAAGSTIKKVSCSDGSELASYTAGNTVNSMPIVNPDVTKVFFGCDDSKAYCVKADLSGTFSVDWPRDVGGPIQTSPAVDLTNNVAVFTTNEGKVYGCFLP